MGTQSFDIGDVVRVNPTSLEDAQAENWYFAPALTLGDVYQVEDVRKNCISIEVNDQKWNYPASIFEKETIMTTTTETTTTTATTPKGHTFTDTDVVNKDNYIPAGEYNPHNIRPFLLTDGIDTLVIFAEHLQDALDIAVDENRLDRNLLTREEAEENETDGVAVAYLGNAGEPFDINDYIVEELTAPAFSFCALFNASTTETLATE